VGRERGEQRVKYIYWVNFGFLDTTADDFIRGEDSIVVTTNLPMNHEDVVMQVQHMIGEAKHVTIYIRTFILLRTEDNSDADDYEPLTNFVLGIVWVAP
jgi:hypothetical protein